MSEENPLWAVGIGDQLNAAVRDNDLQACGEIGVEGYLKAFAVDHPDSEVSFPYAMLSVNGLAHNHVLLVAAAALRRLYNESLRREH